MKMKAIENTLREFPIVMNKHGPQTGKDKGITACGAGEKTSEQGGLS